MESIIVFGTWALCGWICHTIASAKNRNTSLWAVCGVLFGFFAVIIIALMPYVPIS